MTKGDPSNATHLFDLRIPNRIHFHRSRIRGCVECGYAISLIGFCDDILAVTQAGKRAILKAELTMSHRRKIRQIFVIVLLSIVVIGLIFPFVWMLSTAFKPPEEIFTERPRGFLRIPRTKIFFIS